MIFQTERGNHIVLEHVVSFDKVATSRKDGDGITDVYVGVQLSGVPKGSIFNKVVPHVRVKIPGVNGAPATDAMDEDATAKKVGEVEKEAQSWLDRLIKALNDLSKSTAK